MIGRQWILAFFEWKSHEPAKSIRFVLSDEHPCHAAPTKTPINLTTDGSKGEPKGYQCMPAMILAAARRVRIVDSHHGVSIRRAKLSRRRQVWRDRILMITCLWPRQKVGTIWALGENTSLSGT